MAPLIFSRFDPDNMMKYIFDDDRDNSGNYKPRLFEEIERGRLTHWVKTNYMCTALRQKNQNDGAQYQFPVHLQGCIYTAVLQIMGRDTYSIHIYEGCDCPVNEMCTNTPIKKLDFPPIHLKNLLGAISDVLTGKEDLKTIYIKGKQTIITVKAVIRDNESVMSIYQENSVSDMRKRALAMGFPKNFPLPPQPYDLSDGILMSLEDAVTFAHLLNKINMCMKTLYEIKVQRYATHVLVSKIINEKPHFSKKDYYWMVLESFYSLDVQERYRLPAYIVLSDFFKDYFFEPYSLYYHLYCICPNNYLPVRCVECMFVEI